MAGPLQLDQAEELICARLRGEAAPWPQDAPPGFTERVLERATYHGVVQLLHETQNDTLWPDQLRSSFRDESIGRAMWEMRHEGVLRQAIEKMSAAEIRPVLIKGSALAYTHYANPIARTRGDTDLIVAINDMARVHSVLSKLGFDCEVDAGTTILNKHTVYRLALSDGTTHALEVHSRLSVSQLISELLPYGELLKRAMRCERVSAHGLAHGPLDALLINCIHRASHADTPYYANGQTYYGSNRLIWLYDIHVIAAKLTASEWRDLLQLAKGKGVVSLLREGLIAACHCFGTVIPHELQSPLADGDEDTREMRAIRASHYGKIWIDFQNLSSVRQKYEFLKEFLFPPREFILSKHSSARVRWLPWLYLRTVADVALKWIDKKVRRIA